MATRKRTPRKSSKGAGITAAAQAGLVDAMHEIWLAGMGAVSRAQRGTPKILEELVAEGAKRYSRVRGTARKLVGGKLGDVQGVIDARFGGIRAQAADAYENLEKIFQVRVHRALVQLGVPSAETVAALSKRVDSLNDNISKLIRGRARRSGPRRKVARKAARKAAPKGRRARRAA